MNAEKTNARKTIVVGVDGSDAGRRALRWTLDEATRIGAEVHAVSAWSFEVSVVPGVNDPYTAAERAERILADDVAAVTATGDAVPLVQRTIEGSATAVLVQTSAQAHLLVVGSHRHGRLFEAILGSVTAGCLRHATCPVVVVPPENAVPSRPARPAVATSPLY